MPVKKISDQEFKRNLAEIERLGSAGLPLVKIIEKLNFIILTESLSDKPIAWSKHEPHLASWNMACGGSWVNTDNPEGVSSSQPVHNPTAVGTIEYQYRLALCAAIILTLNKIGIRGVALQEAPLAGDIFYETLRTEKILSQLNPVAKGYQQSSSGPFIPTMNTALLGTLLPHQEALDWFNNLLNTYNIHDKEIQLGILDDRYLISVHFEYIPVVNRDDSKMSEQEKSTAKTHRLAFLTLLAKEQSVVIMGDVNMPMAQVAAIERLETYGALGCNTVDVILSANTRRGHQPAAQKPASASSSAAAQSLGAAGGSAPRQPSLFSARHNRLIEIFQETKNVGKQFDPTVMQYESKSYAFAPAENGRFNLSVTYSEEALQRGGSNGVFDALPSTQIKPRNPNEPSTTFQVINQDSFVAAHTLTNPLVLNMANKFSIGGGVEEGSAAQEETLFRCSNYHAGLYPLGLYDQQTRRMKYRHEIPEFGLHYTPEITVFRDATDNYKFLDQPFKVACIAMAGYDLGKPHLLEESLKDLTEDELLLKFKELTKIKIQLFLEVALQEQHENLVLGAISCGAFKLRNDTTGKTAAMVADAYLEVFNQPAYKNKFKNITFAIFDPIPNQFSNYTVFAHKLRSLLTDQPKPNNSLPLPEYTDRQYLIAHRSIRTRWSNSNKQISFAKKDDAERFVRFLFEDQQLQMGSVTNPRLPKTVHREGNTFNVFLTAAQWDTYKTIKRERDAANLNAAPAAGYPSARK